MGKITDVKSQVNSSDRVSIFVDGRFYCGLDKLTFFSANLKEGAEIEEDALEALVLKSETASAFEKASHYLAARMRSETEIRRYLDTKNFLPAAADQAVEKLKSYGYIDDEKFAKVYCESLCSKYGRLRLKADLKRMGVESGVIDFALSKIDFIPYAVEAAEKLSKTTDDKRKLKNRLLAKGFSFDEVGEAIARFEEE